MRRAEHVFRDAGDQPVLDLSHGLAGGQAGTVADAEDVGIDCHRIRAECDIHHDIRRLAPDTGQRFERGPVGWYLSAVTLQQLMAEQVHVMRFRPPQADGADVPRNALFADGRHGGRVGGFLEQAFRRLVDGFVRRLCRQHDAYQKFERIAEHQFTFRIRIGFGKRCDEGLCGRLAHGPLRGCGGIGHDGHSSRVCCRGCVASGPDTQQDTAKF